METKRRYTMRTRADTVARTREEILRAAGQLAEERLTLAIGLADVAGRAGVTVRTVLRHFGSRESLFHALRDRMQEAVMAERAAPVGDVEQAVRAVVAHYDRYGRLVLRSLEEEHLDPLVADQVARGRRLHRDWVRTVFSPLLAAADDPREAEDLLVVATDVYTWKVLRVDGGRSRARTEELMASMVRRVAGHGG